VEYRACENKEKWDSRERNIILHFNNISTAIGVPFQSLPE